MLRYVHGQMDALLRHQAYLWCQSPCRSSPNTAIRPVCGLVVCSRRTQPDGLPPSLFWESDIGKWIESASYYLANPSSAGTPYADEFQRAIDKLIGEMEAFQHADGYLNVYFTVVDPAGKFQNLRDMHEMYNAGHLLEGAIAHYRLTGSRRFLDIMIKNVECFMKVFGPGVGRRPGYPGHPEFELAVLRLYSVTKDPRHFAFAEYMLSARGTSPKALDDQQFFMWEADQRNDSAYGCWMKSKDDLAYHQAHLPLHEQDAILGHSVRAMYLLTACADIGGAFLEDAKRLWAQATEKKMYVTGGFGSEPQSEGFSELEYYLPSSTGEGGCYAETCASIGAMMVSERMLSHDLDGRYRDILELCLYNAVLGGGSLDGKGFSYANKLATYGDESALRSEWFEVCCCPPNLSRTLGILPGYVWSAETGQDFVEVNVYLYISAQRSIQLPNGGGTVEISMQSEMPWTGSVSVEVKAPESAKVSLRLPVADWMVQPKFSISTNPYSQGFVEAVLDASSPRVSVTFGLDTRLVFPDPRVRQDTVTIMRGPIVFVAEDVDNAALEDSMPHFELVGIHESARFDTVQDEVAGVPILRLTTEDVYTLDLSWKTQSKDMHPPLYSSVQPSVPVRSWTKTREPLTVIPWFARGNRGGKGHLRVPFLRVGADLVKGS
ncbi:hypothetical protein DL546_003015 [Coniochaeta pulveracea]|uniref:DUF1680-domain-containing protein n=1 Tax=Coniochaeta pulveracea TaxID=177199 RepID=A0A420XYA1_9PEZI|nr:hypothetical protein DL546_003015 [Coniochaeta pulveracea]